jgi:hypothetical protein
MCKSWKQPLAEMQENIVYIRSKVMGPFSGPDTSGTMCTKPLFCISISYKTYQTNNIILKSKWEYHGQEVSANKQRNTKSMKTEHLNNMGTIISLNPCHPTKYLVNRGIYIDNTE